MNRRRFGKPIGQLSREWKAAGLCRECGAEAHGKRRCVRCAKTFNAAKSQARAARQAAGLAQVVRTPEPSANPASLKPVLVQLPRHVFEAAKADAESRGETLEQWIVAELTASLEPEGDTNAD